MGIKLGMSLKQGASLLRRQSEGVRQSEAGGGQAEEGAQREAEEGQATVAEECREGAAEPVSRARRLWTKVGRTLYVLALCCLRLPRSTFTW